MSDEQKPVAYINVQTRTLEWAKPMRWETPTIATLEPVPLYAHPAPAVVAQLVEALEQLMSIVTIHSRATSNSFAWAEMDEAKEALAAAKEAGL